ncbi:MAG: type III-B CRISPR module RAMP protein Cmr1 [Chloroflexi bacterium]|nr:MAG: type III-B CRISPR module RAMP protein Cmr1 [Chloroflexota bacterium]
MIEQRKLTVTLETVTPMFLAGANKQQPELRAPSIMGALRYWTRAALGGVLGDKNIEALKKAEEEVWGSTNGTGSVRIQVVPTSFAKVSVDPLPHKTKREGRSKPQFCYEGVPVRTSFQLVLSQFGGADRTWELGLVAILLMMTYGGVGRRSRRGWGSLLIKEINPIRDTFVSKKEKEFLTVLTDLMAQGKMTLADWKVHRDWMREQALNVANDLCQSLNLPQDKADIPSRYPLIIRQDQNRIVDRLDTRLTNNPLSAITYFGEQEHDFLMSEKQQNPKVFDAFGYAKGRERWASPLWVRVLPVWDSRKKQKKYTLAFSVFPSDVQGSDYEVIEKFLNEKFPNAIKVRP